MTINLQVPTAAESFLLDVTEAAATFVKTINLMAAERDLFSSLDEVLLAAVKGQRIDADGNIAGQDELRQSISKFYHENKEVEVFKNYWAEDYVD